jgi:hypothetical protein
MRYELYGMLPSEHDDANRDTNSGNQKLSAVIKVYDTDDRDEAKKIVREGGFISPTRGYVVVQGAKDTEGGGTIGVVPENI